MTSHRVLITGIGGNVGQGVLKSLRASERHFYTVGIDMEPLSAGFSLVDAYYQVPRTTDPEFPGALGAIAGFRSSPSRVLASVPVTFF